MTLAEKCQYKKIVDIFAAYKKSLEIEGEYLIDETRLWEPKSAPVCILTQSDPEDGDEIME